MPGDMRTVGGTQGGRERREGRPLQGRPIPGECMRKAGGGAGALPAKRRLRGA